MPDDIADILLHSIGMDHENQSEGAVENVITERKILARSRNRGLRDSCVDASGGMCAGCGYDYALVAANSWRSLLQAHHRTPLHLSDRRQLNKSKDLTAFCPTCHVMAHLRPSRPYTAHDIAARNGGKTLTP
ncbi:hypothetical protein ACXR2U_00545 [Jatrophihabitans sp. YIM 134969]